MKSIGRQTESRKMPPGGLEVERISNVYAIHQQQVCTIVYTYPVFHSLVNLGLCPFIFTTRGRGLAHATLF